MFVLTVHETLNPFNKDEYKLDLIPWYYYFKDLEDAKKAYLHFLRMYQHIEDFDSSNQFVGMVTKWEGFYEDPNMSESLYAFSMGYHTHLNDDYKVELIEFCLHLQKKQLESYEDFMEYREVIPEYSIDTTAIEFLDLVDKIAKIKEQYKVGEAEDGESLLVL